MDDKQILERINELAEKERALYRKEEHDGVSEEERAELQQVEATLDQCWDLLHQRRARRSAGLDPDQAEVRSKKTVEGYLG